MKIALYRHVKLGFVSPQDAASERFFTEDRVRISGYVEVEFPILPAQEAAERELQAVEVEIQTTLNNYSKKLATLRQRKNSIEGLAKSP